MNKNNRGIHHESPSMSKRIGATMPKRMNATVFTHEDSTMHRDGNVTTGGRCSRQDPSCMANLFSHDCRCLKNEELQPAYPS